MIGVDTNVLVRVYLEDSPKEAKAAREFLRKAVSKKQLFLSSYAILEMVWVLKTKKRSRQEIVEAVLDLVDSPGVVVGHRDIVVAALEKYAKGKADFGDYLILAEGEAYHATRLATFDQQLLDDDKRCISP
jgi:predicted nucleic-acid-binding protein